MDCIECNLQDGDGDGCIDLGSAVQMTYLEQITANVVINCYGSVTVSISGGYPEFFTGNYNIVSTGLGTLSSSTISGSGGSIEITGLDNTDGWSITVTDDNGCPVVFSGTYNLNALLSGLPANEELCSGETVNLDGAPSGGTGVYTNHSWTGSTGPLSSTNTQTTIFTAPVVASVTGFVITYSVTDNAGCLATETINVVVNPPPTITGTLNACVGKTTQLTGSIPAVGSSWGSASPLIATVSATGLVTGVALRNKRHYLYKRRWLSFNK